MNKKISSFFLLAVSLAAIPVNAQNTEHSTPVLVELFTSQGCSSCPPAEELLNTWGMELFKAKKALPLAFHVDYWDYLGWKDPFSSSFASQRQKDYAAFFQTNSIYTPQLVVNGQIGFNGADQSKAQTEVAKASTFPTGAPLKFSTQIISNAIRVNIAPPDGIPSQSTGQNTLYVVVFENGLKTEVERGENDGTLLNEDFVVRYQTTIQQSDLDGRKTWKETIPLDSQWKLNHLGVAVWAQDAQTMTIHGLHWIYPISND